MPRTHQIPNRDHPQIKFRDYVTFQRRMLQSLSNASLDTFIADKHLGAIPKERSRKVEILLNHLKDKFKSMFKKEHGFEFDDTADPFLFKQRIAELKEREEIERNKRLEAKKHAEELNKEEERRLKEDCKEDV